MMIIARYLIATVSNLYTTDIIVEEGNTSSTYAGSNIIRYRLGIEK